MIIHGSTMDQFMLRMNENSLMPKFAGMDDKTVSTANYIGSICNIVMVMLCLMQKHIWN
jgi:hypothetical protein